MGFKILTPTVTIFDKNNNIDYDGNEKVINYLLKNGVDGLLPLGSTGEFTHLSFDKKKEFLEFYIKTVDKRGEILAGTSCMDFYQIVQLSNYVLELGANGVMIMDNFYYAQDQQKIVAFYDRLAKNINGDVYIYNFPARSGHDISVESILTLLNNNKNIKGIKDSTINLTHTKEILQTIKNEFEDFKVYSGYDDHFIPNVIQNGNGCIAALSNIVPEIWTKWIEVTNNKEYEKSLKIAKVIDYLMTLYTLDCNFAYLFKFLMKERGLDISTKTIFPYEEVDMKIFAKGSKILNNALCMYEKLYV